VAQKRGFGKRLHFDEPVGMIEKILCRNRTFPPGLTGMGYAISKPMKNLNLSLCFVERPLRTRVRFVVVRLLLTVMLCWSTPTLAVDNGTAFKSQSKQDLILMQGRYQKVQESISQEYRDLKARKLTLENEVRRLRKENRQMVRHPSIFRLEGRNIKKNKLAIAQFKKKVAVVNRKIVLKANEFKTQKDVLKSLNREIAARTVQEQNLVIKVIALGAPKMVQETSDVVRKGVGPQFEKVRRSKDFAGKAKWPMLAFLGFILAGLFVYARRKTNWVHLHFRRSAKPKSPTIDLPVELQREIDGLEVAAKDRIQYI